MTAVDSPTAQVELTRNKPVGQRADFRVADAQQLPSPDAFLDVVASALVMNFIPERRGQLRRGAASAAPAA